MPLHSPLSLSESRQRLIRRSSMPWLLSLLLLIVWIVAAIQLPASLSFSPRMSRNGAGVTVVEAFVSSSATRRCSWTSSSAYPSVGGTRKIQMPWWLTTLSSVPTSTILSTNDNLDPDKTTASSLPNNTPPVRRVYETYRWTYSRPSSSTTTNTPTTSTRSTYNINYRVDGEGPPILLVHGFGANVHHFRYQFPALVAAGYRVYALDLLGFGASDKPLDAATVGFSMELFVQLVQDFVEDTTKLDYDTNTNTAGTTNTSNRKEAASAPAWTLAGNSIGGLCCLGVAAQHAALDPGDQPFNLASVILFNTSGGMTSFRYDQIPAWARPAMAFVQFVVLGPWLGGSFFRNFKTRQNVETILTQQVYRDPTNVDDDLLDALLTPSNDPGAEQVFLAVFGGPPGPTAEDWLSQVTVPVLALWGGDDPWTPVRSSLPSYHPTGDCRLEVLPGVGHCPHDEAPDACNTKMIEFLQTIVV